MHGPMRGDEHLVEVEPETRGGNSGPSDSG